MEQSLEILNPGSPNMGKTWFGLLICGRFVWAFDWTQCLSKRLCVPFLILSESQCLSKRLRGPFFFPSVFVQALIKRDSGKSHCLARLGSVPQYTHKKYVIFILDRMGVMIWITWKASVKLTLTFQISKLIQRDKTWATESRMFKGTVPEVYPSYHLPFHLAKRLLGNRQQNSHNSTATTKPNVHWQNTTDRPKVTWTQNSASQLDDSCSQAMSALLGIAPLDRSIVFLNLKWRLAPASVQEGTR